MKRPNDYTLFDGDKKKVCVYDNLLQITSVIEPGDSVTCTGYKHEDWEVEYEDVLTYEEFWESHFRNELLMEGIELKYFIPKTISDFYKGWKTKEDWHIYQAQLTIRAMNRDLTSFYRAKEKATSTNK